MLFKNAATFKIAACPLWATVPSIRHAELKKDKKA